MPASPQYIGHEYSPVSLWKGLLKWFALATCCGLITILFLGFLPSPVSQLVSGDLQKGVWQIRNQQKNANGQPALIPVHILQTGASLKFALPVYAVVSTATGRYAINWGKIFEYEFITPKPALLPEAWNFPQFSFPAKNIAPAQGAVLAPAQRLFEKNTSWCVVGWGQKNEFTLTAGNPIPSFAFLSDLMTGGKPVVHVDILEGEFPPATTHMLYLTDIEYIQLSDYIYASLATDPTGIPRSLVRKGNGAVDCFFQGAGRFSLLHTNTAWMTQGLRLLHAPTPVWSIFPYFTLWHLPK